MNHTRGITPTFCYNILPLEDGDNFVVVVAFLQAFKILLTFLFFFSRSIERATLIQFDSRYVSKRVPTSLFSFEEWPIWCLDCFVLAPSGFFTKVGSGLGNWKSVHIWFIVVIMWNRPVSMLHCLCGSLIGNKRRSTLKQAPTNYKKVMKEPRWIHTRLSTTLIVDLCVQWNGHGSYHWHKTLHSSTTTHMSTFYLVLIIILGFIISIKRK